MELNYLLMLKVLIELRLYLNENREEWVRFDNRLNLLLDLLDGLLKFKKYDLF